MQISEPWLTSKLPDIQGAVAVKNAFMSLQDQSDELSDAGLSTVILPSSQLSPYFPHTKMDLEIT